MSTPDFIEIYPGALGPAVCAEIIRYFDACGQATRGETGSGVDLELKDSWDVMITGRPDWQPLHDAIQGAAFAGLRQYVMRYGHVLTAPLRIKMRRPDGALRAIDPDDFASLDPADFDRMLQFVFRPGTINVQRYIADEGGYPYWHCEHYPKRGDDDALHRVLLYTIYLNDGFDGGETDFFHQQRSIVPKTGDLLIAPAAFTHTHRGNRPQGCDKYIATSWILFNRAEQLFPG
jgi:hypothetical protein